MEGLKRGLIGESRILSAFVVKRFFPVSFDDAIFIRALSLIWSFDRNFIKLFLILIFILFIFDE